MKWLALTAVFLLGCAQPTLTVDEYVGSLEQAADAYVADTQALSTGYQDRVIGEIRTMLEGAPDDGAERAVAITSIATTEYLTVLADDMLVFLDTMSDLEPPEAVRDEHDEFVAAVRSVHAAIPPTITVVSASGSIDGIRFALTSSGFADGQIRWTTACSSLESAVRTLGSGIDIGCVRPEIVP